MALQSNSYYLISTCSVAGVATQILTGQGTLKRIVINTSTNCVVGIDDGTTETIATKSLIGVIKKNPVQNVFNYDLRTLNGIRVITQGPTTIKPSITVIYNQ